MKISKNSELVGNKITFKLLLRKKSEPIKTKKFLGCGYCDAFSKSKELKNGVYTNDFHVICNVAKILLGQILENDLFSLIPDIRGMGLTVSGMKNESNDEENSKEQKKKPKASPKKKNLESDESTSNLDAFLKPKDKKPKKRKRDDFDEENDEEEEEEDDDSLKKKDIIKKKKTVQKIEDFFQVFPKGAPEKIETEKEIEKEEVVEKKKRKIQVFDWETFNNTQISTIQQKDENNFEKIAEKFKNLLWVDENCQENSEKRQKNQKELERFIFKELLLFKEFTPVRRFFSIRVEELANDLFENSGDSSNSSSSRTRLSDIDERYFLNLKKRIDDLTLQNYGAHLFEDFA